MRLSIVNEASVWGGQEHYLHLLVEGLARAGVLKAVTFEGGPEALAAFMPVSVINAIAPDTPHVRILNGNRALYRNAWRRRGPEVRVYVQHSSIDDRQAGFVKSLIRRLLLRVLLRRVEVVIRVSRACLPDSYALGKTHTIPNGVDLARFPCRKAWRLGDDGGPLKLLMVGALTANKNQRLAVRLLASWPSATLTLVGDGPERLSLLAEADRLGVAQRIHWLGMQGDPAPFYREADVCLLLSRFEAAPFVLLEAMASGTPVVATSVGGVPEVLEDGVNGRLLPEATVPALQAVLEELLRDPSALKRLGLAARQTIELRYTVKHMCEGFVEAVGAASS